MSNAGTVDVLDAIRAEMVQRNVSQRELARRLGWNPVHTHRRVTGKVPLSVTDLREIAAALDVPVSDLLADTPAEVVS